LNHGITNGEGSWKKSVAAEFVNRYLFPESQFETISTVQQFIK
tara:strand:- start:29121 stop:29249 length:129 start_codon:yes stop_codon:yes gene_type:complete